MPTYTFDSKSSPGTRYTAAWDREEDGKLRCDCRGWTMRREGARHCTHTKQIAMTVRDTHRVEERGEFVYLVSMDEPVRPLGGPAMAPVTHLPDAPPSMPLPMLAAAGRGGQAANIAEFDRRYWGMEEKLDGHRVLVEVVDNGMRSAETVLAWSRPRAGEAPKRRELPPQVFDEMMRMPPGLYDGELYVYGGKSSDVVSRGASVRFGMFDLLQVRGESLLTRPYTIRREHLAAIADDAGVWFHRIDAPGAPPGAVHVVDSVEPSVQVLEAIWSRGGEGVILKRLASPYQSGIRSEHWIKVKKQGTAIITVTGFKDGKTGRCAILCGEDVAGNAVRVKVLDMDELRAIQRDPASHIGRLLVIAFQEQLASGAYRHPMWDHWAVPSPPPVSRNVRPVGVVVHTSAPRITIDNEE